MQQSEVAHGGGIANLAVILSERHVQYPVQTVFDGPMTMDSLRQDRGIVHQAGEEVTNSLDLVAAVDAANRFNHQHYLEFQPILECFQGDRPKIGEDLSTDPGP